MTATKEKETSTALEVVDRLTGEVLDVRQASTEQLAGFELNLADLRAQLAEAEGHVSRELVRRLDRRGEWTQRVKVAIGGVEQLVEIKSPSPTAGTSTIAVDVLEAQLRKLVDADVIDVEAAEKALERTLTVAFRVPLATDLEAVKKAVGEAERQTEIAGHAVEILKVDVDRKAQKGALSALEKIAPLVKRSIATARRKSPPAGERRASVKVKAE